MPPRPIVSHEREDDYRFCIFCPEQFSGMAEEKRQEIYLGAGDSEDCRVADPSDGRACIFLYRISVQSPQGT